MRAATCVRRGGGVSRARHKIVVVVVASLASGTLARCGGGGTTGISSSALVRITTEALPDALTGAAYEATLAATGPHVPVAWRVVGGRLPTGLALDGERGVIAGFPRDEGRFRVELEARDGLDANLPRDVVFAADRRAFDVTVGRGPLVVLPLPLEPAQFAAYYEHRFAAAGGVAPYRFEHAGGALPMGL